MIAQSAFSLSVLLDVLLVGMSLGLLLAFYRAAVGPSLPDRVIALDLMSTLIVGLIGLYAIAESDATFLRVAMVIALINFLGTIGFARYLHKRATR